MVSSEALRGSTVAANIPSAFAARCYHSLDNTAAVLVPTLSAETRSRLPQALRHATQKRQREFLAGRWCAEQTLQCLGAGSTHVAMADEATLFKAADGCSFCEFCTFVFSAKGAVFNCIFPLRRRFLEFSDVRLTSFDWDRRHFTWTITTEHMERDDCCTMASLCIPWSNCLR
jgi:4'-phosphopantetheinyl transferase EntD